jgi:hypothetical protein
MKPKAEAVREIIKGLEGIQMLSQWEQSLAKDLTAKAESLLRSIPAAPPPGKGAPGRSDDA